MASEEVAQGAGLEPMDSQEAEEGQDNAPQSPTEIVKQQEEMLKSKYPGVKPGAGSSLLQKRMHKGQKYFDSGDYNVAKSKIAHAKPISPKENALLTESTGDEIPTPENLPRKPALAPSKLVIS